ncbi:hypothetical protein GCM10010400_19760 [Streptomyces aculeolatus]
MTDPAPSSPPEWIARILERWVPPEDYDDRLSAVVDEYAADRRHTEREATRPTRTPRRAA